MPASGPHEPGAYGSTGGALSRSGSTTRHASSMVSWRAKRTLRPSMAAWFPEYFHGDTGAGLGAMHQTGWTAEVVNLLLAPPRDSAPG